MKNYLGRSIPLPSKAAFICLSILILSTQAEGQSNSWRNSAGSSAQMALVTEAIRRNPNDANALTTRAVYYLNSGVSGAKPTLKQLDLAVTDLDRAIKADPKSFYAHHNYGHAASLAGYHEIAIDEFTKAIAVNPQGSGKSYLGRGWAHFESCHLDQAASDFKQAVLLDSSFRDAIAVKPKVAGRKLECLKIDRAAKSYVVHPGSQGMLGLQMLFERTEAELRSGGSGIRRNSEASQSNKEQNQLFE